MIYNVDFLLAGLTILIIVLFHMMRGMQLKDAGYPAFQVFLVLSVLNVIFDLICAVQITGENASWAGAMWFSITIMYMLQILVVYAFLCFLLSMRKCSGSQKRSQMLRWGIPALVMLLLILTNSSTGLLFTVGADGSYIRGPWYMSVYYFAGIYMVIAAVLSVVCRKEIGFKQMSVTLECVLVAGIFVGVEALYHSILLSGFGLSLCIMIQYLTAYNAYRYTDNLTGTYDSSSFKQWYQEQIKRNQSCFFLTVDIPQMKRINYIYGTDFGDNLLLFIAGGLQRIGGEERVFRLGGNRFLLNTYTLEEYEGCRRGVLSFLETPFCEEEGQLDFFTVVCGIPNAEKLQEAGKLLNYIEYLSSLTPATGRTVWIQDNEKSMEGFLYQQEVERFLQTAIDQDLFELYYQPVYSVSRKGYVNLEALSRLRHPALGMIFPDVFIGIAERTGQITQIGYLQFRRMCRFVKEHPILLEQLDNIKFNLSPAEILKQGYSESLLEVIREYELPFSFFQFEITETVATEYNNLLFHSIQIFREVGIELCLDDFGSGYANLNAVMKLPFSTVKLDRSLLSGICDKAKVASFYESVVSIMHRLGYHLIAEGVETGEELELLTRWGVDSIQGYYFAKPMEESALLNLLNESLENRDLSVIE